MRLCGVDRELIVAWIELQEQLPLLYGCIVVHAERLYVGWHFRHHGDGVGVDRRVVRADRAELVDLGMRCRSREQEQHSERAPSDPGTARLDLSLCLRVHTFHPRSFLAGGLGGTIVRNTTATQASAAMAKKASA